MRLETRLALEPMAVKNALWLVFFFDTEDRDYAADCPLKPWGQNGENCFNCGRLAECPGSPMRLPPGARSLNHRFGLQILQIMSPKAQLKPGNCCFCASEKPLAVPRDSLGLINKRYKFNGMENN